MKKLLIILLAMLAASAQAQPSLSTVMVTNSTSVVARPAGFFVAQTNTADWSNAVNAVVTGGGSGGISSLANTLGPGVSNLGGGVWGVSSNYDARGAAQAVTNGYAWSPLYDSAGAAAAAQAAAEAYTAAGYQPLSANLSLWAALNTNVFLSYLLTANYNTNWGAWSTNVLGTFDQIGSAAAVKAALVLTNSQLTSFVAANYQPLSTDLTQWSGISTNSFWGWVTTYVGAQGFLTGNQTITLSKDATGSGATAIAVTVTNAGDLTPGQTLPAMSGANLTSLPGANVTGTVPNATTAVNFSGSLAGNVTGTQGATVVSAVPIGALPFNLTTNLVRVELSTAPTNGQMLVLDGTTNADGSFRVYQTNQPSGGGGYPTNDIVVCSGLTAIGNASANQFYYGPNGGFGTSQLAVGEQFDDAPHTIVGACLNMVSTTAYPTGTNFVWKLFTNGTASGYTGVSVTFSGPITSSATNYTTTFTGLPFVKPPNCYWYWQATNSSAGNLTYGFTITLHVNP